MLSACASICDFRALARRRLPHFLFEYYDGSSFAGITSQRNRDDLDAIELAHPTLAADDDRMVMQSPDTRVSIFGQTLSLPVVLGPVGLAGMAWPRGERQAARAAAAAGVATCLSSTSICDIAEVAGEAPPWFQLYLLRDRDLAEGILSAALDAGCRTLVLTVDTPMLGIRWRDYRSGLNDRTLVGTLRRGAQIAARPGWSMRTLSGGMPITLGNISRVLGGGASLAECMAFTATGLETRFDAATLRWLRAKWPHTLIIKGVSEPEDAMMAVDCGFDGIVVSNHGGRQLDGVRSSIRSLVAIADTLQSRVPLMLDSGVRSGIDVVKALALGASAVLIGRPWVFALGAGGYAGVSRLLECLAREVEVAMALCGVSRISDLRQGGVATIPANWRR